MEIDDLIEKVTTLVKGSWLLRQDVSLTRVSVPDKVVDLGSGFELIHAV